MNVNFPIHEVGTQLWWITPANEAKLVEVVRYYRLGYTVKDVNTELCFYDIKPQDLLHHEGECKQYIARRQHNECSRHA